MTTFARQLERELNALTSERNNLDASLTAAISSSNARHFESMEHEAKSKQLERELAEAREDAANQRRLADMALAHRDVIIAERDKWKANHDNQVVINRTLRDRPDLGERAKLVEALTKQRDHYKAACDQYSEDEMLCKFQEVTKQRDALAEALEKAKIAEMQLENADINLEQCRLNFVGRIEKLEQELKEALTAITQSKEANAGLMRACDKLESELADMTKQRNALAEALGPFVTLNPLSKRVQERWHGYVLNAKQALAALKGELQ